VLIRLADWVTARLWTREPFLVLLGRIVAGLLAVQVAYLRWRLGIRPLWGPRDR
jgi:hypothetical protein